MGWRRTHVATNGLTIAVFRQSISRADDPQLHSHVIISCKVRTPGGRWYALDARFSTSISAPSAACTNRFCEPN